MVFARSVTGGAARADALFAVPAGYTLAPPFERGGTSLLSRALSIFR